MSNAMRIADDLPDFAWVRTRKTGGTWYVTGAVLDRTLSAPDDYELLIEDEKGNYVGEAGDVVIAAPAAPASTTAVAALEPVKLVVPRKAAARPKQTRTSRATRTTSK